MNALELRDLCVTESSQWTAALEPLGFTVQTAVQEVPTESAVAVTLRAERPPVLIEVRAHVADTPHGPVWTVEAPLFHGTRRFATLTTPGLVLGQRIADVANRLLQLDSETSQLILQPSRWTCRAANLPPPQGGVTLIGRRGNALTQEMLQTLARATSILYSLVAAAQQAPRLGASDRDAQFEVVVTTVALLAGEVEAFAQLAAVGLEGPAQVHARAVGYFATRIALYRENATVAVEVYNSFPASLVDLLEDYDDEHHPLSVTLPDGASSVSMRTIERRTSFKRRRNEIAAEQHLLSLAEHETLSKRAHGDVTAMAQVARCLSHRGTDVREPITRLTVVASDNELTLQSLIVRTLGYALHAAIDMMNIVHVDADEHLQQIATEHARFQALLSQP